MCSPKGDRLGSVLQLPLMLLVLRMCGKPLAVDDRVVVNVPREFDLNFRLDALVRKVDGIVRLR